MTYIYIYYIYVWWNVGTFLISTNSILHFATINSRRSPLPWTFEPGSLLKQRPVKPSCSSNSCLYKRFKLHTTSPMSVAAQCWSLCSCQFVKNSTACPTSPFSACKSSTKQLAWTQLWNFFRLYAQAIRVCFFWIDWRHWRHVANLLATCAPTSQTPRKALQYVPFGGSGLVSEDVGSTLSCPRICFRIPFVQASSFFWSSSEQLLLWIESWRWN